MSEQFPRVYFGSKEEGCLWEEAVVTEAKKKKPPQLRQRQPTPFQTISIPEEPWVHFEI